MDVLKTRVADMETMRTREGLLATSTSRRDKVALDRLTKECSSFKAQAVVDAASIEQANALLIEADTKVMELEQRASIASKALAAKELESDAFRRTEELSKGEIKKLRKKVEELTLSSSAAIGAADRAEAATATLRHRITTLEASQEEQQRVDREAIAKQRRELDHLLRHQKELEEEHRMLAEEDAERLQGLQAVNARLAAFAADTQFQEDLQRSNVKIALDAWGGEERETLNTHPNTISNTHTLNTPSQHVHSLTPTHTQTLFNLYITTLSSGENLEHYTEAQLALAREDGGVIRMYESLKDFERVCDRASIRFPVDHLVLHLASLSEEAIRYNFGPDFVAKHVPPSPHGKQRAVSFGQGRIRTIGDTPLCYLIINTPSDTPLLINKSSTKPPSQHTINQFTLFVSTHAVNTCCRQVAKPLSDLPPVPPPPPSLLTAEDYP